MMGFITSHKHIKNQECITMIYLKLQDGSIFPISVSSAKSLTSMRIFKIYPCYVYDTSSYVEQFILSTVDDGRISNHNISYEYIARDIIYVKYFTPYSMTIQQFINLMQDYINNNVLNDQSNMRGYSYICEENAIDKFAKIARCLSTLLINNDPFIQCDCGINQNYFKEVLI